MVAVKGKHPVSQGGATTGKSKASGGKLNESNLVGRSVCVVARQLQEALSERSRRAVTSGGICRKEAEKRMTATGARLVGVWRAVKKMHRRL